jgi:pimeloyl-ACP methyl ester carboxylesterase
MTMPSVVYGTNMLVENVQGIKIPNTVHFIQGEQPQFLINQLSNFLGQDTTKMD